MPAARIRRLRLNNFRTYHAAQIDVGAPAVVLVGPNGAGKTNLLEAISFLAPGRGLRRATLEDVAFAEGDGSWAVSADVEGALGLATLATGIDPPPAEDASVDAQVPDRPRAGSFRHRLRRSPAGQLAHPGDGPAVHRPGLGAPALSRPAGAGGRRRAHDAGQCARPRAALAQPAAGGPARRFPLARRHRARDRRARGRGQRACGPKRCRACRPCSPSAAIRPRRSPPPRSRSTAGWTSW